MLCDMHWTGKVDSVAFTIGGKDIAFFIIAIPLAIIGARLGYVMVRPEYFPSDFGWDDFVNVIAVWDGGLTIMTGVPFGVLGGAIWCKWRKVNLIDLADIIIPVVLLSQGLGRWGNFCNQEIFGAEITNPDLQFFPIAVYIARLGGFYQALFFYEMVMDLAFFAAMMIILRHLKVRGAGSLMYLFSYCLIRFVMEFIRDDGHIYDVFNYTQVICGILVVVSAGLLTYLIVRDVKKGKKVWYGKGGIPLEETVQIHPYHKPSKKDAGANK